MTHDTQANTNARNNGYATLRDLTPRPVSVSGLKLLGRATHKHPPQQIRRLAECLKGFGFVLPILIDSEQRVVAGWALVLAARLLGLDEVPAVILSGLSKAELRTLRLALNRIAEDASWDREALSLEFSELLEINPQIELEMSGFEVGEIDSLLDDGGISEEDDLPEVKKGTTTVSQNGDLWILGEHRLLCGDALRSGSYAQLLGEDKAGMMFTDPPYNVPVDGHVSGLGAVKHAEFAMASGELSSTEFEAFLRTSFGHAANWSVDGSIHYVCMDWRHQTEILAASKDVYSGLVNLCIWNKCNAGMGSLYRSKHELIYVFKAGKGAHINNVALGRYGRHRTNVWDYISQNSLNGSSKSKLPLHPTAKPVAMIADAIRDCSTRSALILDPFGGAGTTLIAAERTSRRARVIEIDPTYVDASVRRWEKHTGGSARLSSSNLTFGEVANQRETNNDILATSDTEAPHDDATEQKQKTSPGFDS